MRTTNVERVQKHRAGLRALGLRPVQIWVPDTTQKDFVAECRRQSALLANDPHEKEVLDWIEKASDYEDWKP